MATKRKLNLYGCACTRSTDWFVAESRATCSVGNDKDSRGVAQRLHRSFGGPVDLFAEWLLIIRARPVELSVAEHDPPSARTERSALRQLGHRARRAIVRRRFAAGFSAIRSAARPRNQNSSVLGPGASVEICVFTNLRRIIRQISQLVQYRVV